jgi:hypothetical protein
MSTKTTDTTYGRQGGRLEPWPQGGGGPVVYVSCGCGRSWVVPADARAVCDVCGVRRLPMHEGVLEHEAGQPMPKPDRAALLAYLDNLMLGRAESDWRPALPPAGALAAARKALRS